MRELVLLSVVAACAPVVGDAPAAVERESIEVEGSVRFFGVVAPAHGRITHTGERLEAVVLDAEAEGFEVNLRLGVQVTGPSGEADIVQHWGDALGPLPTIKHRVEFTFHEELTITSEDLEADVYPVGVP
jgi:hypothetical protein